MTNTHLPFHADPSNDWDDVVYNLGRLDPSWHPTEVHPRLWLSGTPDSDLVIAPGTLTSPWSPSITAGSFDACVTLTPVAGPAGTGVVEHRVTFQDATEVSGHPERDLFEAASWAAGRWQRGDRVVVRCRAGLNRSGIVAGLVLCMVEPELRWSEAVFLLRNRRHRLVLCNPSLYDLGQALSESSGEKQ